MSYTKGEWEWVSLGDYVSLECEDKVIIYPDEQYNLVATQEDKNLISAAPDMYEALKKIECIIDAFGFEICPCCEYYNDSGHHPNCAVAQAIAKAEGKTEGGQ